MTSHHLMEQKEIRHICPYCKQDLTKLDDWNSKFDVSMHYKEINCKCGKNNWIAMDFIGSGHDHWTDESKGKKTIENKIIEAGKQ